MYQIPQKKTEIGRSFSHRHTTLKSGKQTNYQRVIGNKFEGQGYADKRKRKVVNQYRRERKKLLQNSTATASVSTPLESGAADKVGSLSPDVTGRSTTRNQGQEGLVERDSQRSKFKRGQDRKHKDRQGQQFKSQRNRFWQAEQEHKQKKAQRQKNKEEYLERQAKQAAALKVYKEKKLARHKKLSRKTERGQPVMKYQIEYLLEKLKNE